MSKCLASHSFRVLVLGVASAAGAAMPGCRSEAEVPEAGAVRVAVANTYLEAAVREFLGADATVLRLAEPGMCPGHFDLRPSQMQALRHCRMLLRFDFQRGLATKVASVTDEGLQTRVVTVSGGMCEPKSFREACAQVGLALADTGLVRRADVDRTLDELGARLDALAARTREKLGAADLSGSPVVVSQHQAAFCEMLGLRVVGTFGGADTTSVGEIDRAIQRGDGARFVIANRPEGTALADALAGRLNVPLVVFDNFPAPAERAGCFDRLVRENVARLLAAAP